MNAKTAKALRRIAREHGEDKVAHYLCDKRNRRTAIVHPESVRGTYLRLKKALRRGEIELDRNGELVLR